MKQLHPKKKKKKKKEFKQKTLSDVLCSCIGGWVNIYSGCQGQYKLGPEGALRVPSTAAEAFCGGPCLAEANLVLGYVDAIMDSFRFYNGATIRDVRLTLDRGCGRSGGLRRVATPRR